MTSNWLLTDLPKPSGPKVFSCFHCGGGSTMGYKLAGCDVVGGVDIDPKIVELYRLNHQPRVSYVSDIRTAPVPDEHIDILDGSPPCTPFSTNGLREKAWGKAKAFGEGNTTQTLDDLFLHYLAYVEKIMPRVVVAENVMGLVYGNARSYVQNIKSAFERLGYSLQLFQLTAADFGVPQTRPRVFFVARKGGPALRMPAGKPLVTARQAFTGIDSCGEPLGPLGTTGWHSAPPGRPYGSFLTNVRLNPDSVAPTLTTQCTFAHWEKPVKLSAAAFIRLQSFPDDYNFSTLNAQYVCGMSVAPFVMRELATQIVQQLF